MDNVSLRTIFDQKGKAGKDPKVKALLHVEVRDKQTNKKIYISTDVKILAKHYTKDGSIIKSDHPNAAILRKKVQSIYNKIEAFVFSDKCETFADVPNWNKVEEQLTTNIVDFIRADLARRDATFAVIEYNNSFIKRLEEYGKMVTFKDITYNHLEEFDTLLRKYIKSSPTLYKRHSLFKGYIENAKRKGLTEYNPYDDFQLKKGKSKDPVYLIESEVQRIINYKTKGSTAESLERVKDLFLFQCFTGLAYIDLMNFNEKSISKIDGHKVIQSNRQKTDENYITLFLPEAEKIADKYQYELPKITNQKYNEYLKKVAVEAGINKPLVSHTARHSKNHYSLSAN